MATWVKIDKGSEQEYYDLEKAFALKFNQGLGTVFVVYPGLTIALSSGVQAKAFAAAIDYLNTIEASL